MTESTSGESRIVRHTHHHWSAEGLFAVPRGQSPGSIFLNVDNCGPDPHLRASKAPGRASRRLRHSR